jgi:mannobiose 2-epimerase
MDARVLQDYAGRIETDLRENILPFWMNRVVDQERRGFFGSITNELVIDRGAGRGALLTTRILWTFSAAYRRYRDGAYLAMADHAARDLMEHFHDRTEGGFFWSIAANGRVIHDRKQIYGQAFAIYALAEYHRARSLIGPTTVTSASAPLETAIATFRLIEQHAREPRYGGYLEAFDRGWQPVADMRLSAIDLNEPKSQNTHLHLLEAYTHLLHVWQEAGLRQALTQLVGLMLERIVDPHTAHLGLFFAEDWTLRSDRVSYGHDIEAAWLLIDAAAILQDDTLLRRVHALARRIADVTLDEGVDVDGGIFNAGSPHGLVDSNKEWWPQAEAVVGFLAAHRVSGDERHLLAALRAWDFIEQHLIDRRHGEWLRGVTRSGAVLAEEKVGFWKCPYHNGRTALEATERLRILARDPNP